MNLIKDIHDYLASDMSKLNELILSYLDSQEDLIEVVSKHLINGKSKRIRPILTILTNKLFTKDTSVDAIKLAAAVEFIHTATLLHDDVVDDSKMRRFKPTANILWGNKASILVGDFLFSQSFKLMVATNSLAALTTLANASAIIAEGEVAQLEKLNERKLISTSEYHRIISAKTAKLFGAACEVGAIIAGEQKGVCDIMKEFGTNLGVIFQIADDCLDYFSEAGKIGKNPGDDFLEGKVTLPLILTYEKSKTEDQRKIDKMIQANTRSQDEFSWILKEMNECGIRKDIWVYLENLKIETVKLLRDNILNNKSRDYMIELVDFAMSRTY